MKSYGSLSFSKHWRRLLQESALVNDIESVDPEFPHGPARAQQPAAKVSGSDGPDRPISFVYLDALRCSGHTVVTVQFNTLAVDSRGGSES